MIPRISHPIGSSIKDFQVLGKIGSGGFATVYKAKSLNDGYEKNELAIKKICKEKMRAEKLKKRIQTEVKIHSSLTHENIVKFWASFEDENYVYLVLDLCEGKSIEDYLKRHKKVPEEKACRFIRQIIEGVRYLHSKMILHRDLSLRNILLTQHEEVKIIDFGMAIELECRDAKCLTMLGTPNFISPEMVKHERYDSKSDCWAVGCVLFALLFGSPPFHGKRYQEILNAAVTEELLFPARCSQEAKELLVKLLHKDPNYRIGIHETLNYSFFEKYYDPKQEGTNKRNGDSGMSSLSSSRSAHKNQGNSDEKPKVGDISLERKKLNYLSDYHSVSCESLSQCSGNRHPKQRPKFPLPRKEESSVSHFKNPIQTFLSRQEPMYSCSLKYWDSRQDEIKWHSNQSAPTCVSKGHPLCHSDIRSESQIHAWPYASTESHLPFPKELSQRVTPLTHCNLLQNKNQCCTPKDTFCSHVDQCCISGSQCSHEMICCCRQHCVPVSTENRNAAEQSGQLEGDIQLILREHRKKIKRRGLNGVMNPLTTARLVPQRRKQSLAIITVMEDGQLCLEFLDVRKSGKYLESVCFISGDGLTIMLHFPKKPIETSSQPPPLPNSLGHVKHFTYTNLPEKHWRKYWYAKTFVEKVRVKTPKVTLYNKDGKCVMMENTPTPNYEIDFYNGYQMKEEHIIVQDPRRSYEVTKSLHRTLFVDPSGTCTEVEQQSDLRAEFQFMWDVFATMKQKCRDIEARLEGSESCFPVVVGRKPLSFQKTNEKNSTPQSLQSSQFSKVKSHAQSVQSTPPSRVLTSPFKDIFQILLQLMDKPKIVNGKLLVEYKDGFEMWSSMNGKDIYFYDTHLRERVMNIEQKPEIWKRVLEDLPAILVDMLAKR